MATGSDTLYNLASICETIADGGTLKQCAEDHLVTAAALREWIYLCPERIARYEAARIQQAHAIVDDIHQLSDEMAGMNANLVQGYRAAIDAKKWLASKFCPRIYGDKLDLTHSGQVTVSHEQALLALDALDSGVVPALPGRGDSE